MYPILFTIPGIDYQISSFGVMMAMGFLAAYWLTVRELPGKGIDPEISSNLLLFVMIGGILGAKLYFATDMVIREGQPWRVRPPRRKHLLEVHALSVNWEAPAPGTHRGLQK